MVRCVCPMADASLEPTQRRRVLTARSTLWARLKFGRRPVHPLRPLERSGMSTTDWRCSYTIRARDFGREVYNRVDTWTADAEDNLYGGTSDGYLFRLNPANLTVVNLGKPLNQYRIRGLVLAHNGRLYGIGGDDDEMARLFSYDPASGLYELLGMIDVNH